MLKGEKTEGASFDIDKALNTRGFAEFLGKFPDATAFSATEENAGEVRIRFETFEKKKEVASRLKRFFIEDIKATTRIDLNERDFAALDDELERKAIEDPEGFVAILSHIDESRDARAAARTAETRLEQLTGAKDREGREEIKSALGKMGAEMKTGGVFKRGLRQLPILGRALMGKDGKTAMEALSGTAAGKRMLGVLYAPGYKLGEVERAETNAGELLGSARETRDGLIDEFRTIGEAYKKAEEEAQKKLAGTSIDSMDLSRLQQTYSYAEHLRRMAGEEGTLDGSKFGTPEDMKELEGVIKARLEKDIGDAIGKADLGNNAFTKLETALKKFFELKEVGSRKEGQAVAELVLTTLREAREKTGDGAKRILLSRIIEKTARENK
ncbi:MAG: hypothetical protein V1856_03280 [Candidatus Liptonbacteria bacterium]